VIALLCHPQTPTEVVYGVEAEALRVGGGTISLRFVVRGDIERIRVPEKMAPAIVFDLWQHTCCEAFVAIDGASAYHELNLSPSGQWAIFAFERYRDGLSILDETHAPRIDFRSSPDRLELEALVEIGRFSTRHAEAPLRLGLAAVVEERDGALSYWALHHPPGVADFHHADAMRLVL
jgi:hypothetical protein